MKKIVYLAAATAFVYFAAHLTALVAHAAPQTDKLDAAGLRKAIEGMGYEVKELSAEAGKEKYEFTAKRPSLDIPIAAEISPSKNYIWLTVLLQSDPIPAAVLGRAADMLKSNHNTQPSFIYISSKGALFMGIPIDNRGMSAAVLKRCSDKIADDVASTQKYWGN